MGVASKISSLHPFMNSAVIINISNGVVETLQTMAQISSLFEKSFVEKKWKSPSEISVYIDLESPPYSGQVRFHFSRKVLADLCKIMMNEEIAPDSPEVIDCLGELANICYGYAKAKLNAQGYSLRMSLPRPSKTEDLPPAVSAYPHIIIPFKVLDDTCYIEIVIL